MYLSGLIQAFIVVLLSAVFNIYVRFATLVFNVEPIVFGFVSMISAALVLSLASGPGKLVTETAKNKSTWLYGFCSIAVFITDIYLSRYVSATEVSLISRIAIPLSIIAAFMFLKRSPKKEDALGVSLVILGLIILTTIQNSLTLHIVALLALATGIVQTGEYMFAETHKQSSQAQSEGTIRDKARVVGFVSFITSMIFFGFVLILSLLKTYTFSDTFVDMAFIPPLHMFVHKESILTGLFYGVFISSVLRYCLWSASYKIKTESILALMALVPIVTLLLEWLVSLHPKFSQNLTMFEGERGHIILIVTVLMSIGSGLSVFLRARREIAKEKSGNFWTDLKKSMTIDKQDISIHHSTTAKDDYDIVCSALEYTRGDKEKASRLLEMSENTFTVLLEGKGSLALVEEESKKLARKYRNKIAKRDALTGLMNRSSFMSQAKDELETAKQASILFIDLNKFKPVNDTYGHEAGDFILKGVAERLTALLPKRALIARLGGDEFTILLQGKTKEHVAEHAEAIKKSLAEPFDFNGTEIIIGGSIGIATAPEDGNDPEKLLKLADEGMYKEKSER